jgi:hypothetical protein
MVRILAIKFWSGASIIPWTTNINNTNNKQRKQQNIHLNQYLKSTSSNESASISKRNEFKGNECTRVEPPPPALLVPNDENNRVWVVSQYTEWCDAKWSDVMWCDCDCDFDVMWCDWCNLMRCVWCDMMCCDDALCCDLTWCDMMWCDVMWCVVMWYDVMWCNVIVIVMCCVVHCYYTYVSCVKMPWSPVCLSSRALFEEQVPLDGEKQSQHTHTHTHTHTTFVFDVFS